MYNLGVGEKSFIFKNEFNVLEAQSMLFPEKDWQGYQFKIVKNGEV